MAMIPAETIYPNPPASKTVSRLNPWSASAVAALICTTAPGCVHPPTLAQTLAFLSARGAPVPLI